MSYIAAMFVLYLSDTFAAFAAFANLLSRPYFRAFFKAERQQDKQRFVVFDNLFRASIPSLHRHFRSIGFKQDMYLTNWFMTVFTKSVPLNVASRLWDCYLCDGEAVVFKAALAILQLASPDLLTADLEEATRVLNTTASRIEEAQLLDVMSRVPLPVGTRQAIVRLEMGDGAVMPG